MPSTWRGTTSLGPSQRAPGSSLGLRSGFSMRGRWFVCGWVEGCWRFFLFFGSNGFLSCSVFQWFSVEYVCEQVFS